VNGADRGPPHRHVGTMAPAIRLIVFDLDGTLIDSRLDLATAVNHVLRELGFDEIVPETVYGYVGDGARMLVERALGPARRDLVPRALDLFVSFYGAHLLDRTRPYPGMRETLDALRARDVVLSVLTNKPERMSRTIIQGLGLEALFVDVVGGDSLPQRKPDPAGLEQLRIRTGTPRDRLLLVGDSRIDLATARAAGVPFCGVTWGFGPAALLAERPERVIERPHDLLALVAGGAVTRPGA
jgi:phosphoglycolate phosphatase